MATGGTLNAAIQLVRLAGGEVVQILLINKVGSLDGVKKLMIEPEKVFYMYDIWLWIWLF